MIVIRNAGKLEKYTMYPITLCSFSKNISGPMINLYWVRFPCNHSYGYAFRRIVQTDSLIFPQNSAFLWNIRADMFWPVNRFLPFFSQKTIHGFSSWNDFSLFSYKYKDKCIYLLLFFFYPIVSTLGQDTARQFATVDHADMRGLVTTGLHCIAELAFL